MRNFKIKATVNGKSWLTKSTVLKANNESDAIERAKEILRLTDEHETISSECTVRNVNDKLKTDSYPYGRDRATAFFSVEMNKKGCRTVFQTINPKTGRLNNPKNSTYYPVILPAESENGFIDFVGYLNFNSTEEINKGLYFMEDFKHCFNPEQIKDIAIYIIMMTKVNAKSQVIYCGTEWDNLKQYYEQPIKNLVKIANGESDNFLDCLLDFDSIEALKVPDYQPFKVAQY